MINRNTLQSILDQNAMRLLIVNIVEQEVKAHEKKRTKTPTTFLSR
jgi:hypothetical protein